MLVRVVKSGRKSLSIDSGAEISSSFLFFLVISQNAKQESDCTIVTFCNELEVFNKSKVTTLLS